MNPSTPRALVLLLFLIALMPGLASAKPIEVLVYSKTSWYRHPEIARINGYLAILGAKNGINVSITESPDELSARKLGNYDLILFNNSTNLGESLTTEQRKPIIDWFRKGGGIMVMQIGRAHV